MVKLPTSLKYVDSRKAGGCQKPGCEVSGTLHRHHRRHEAMWLGIWATRRRGEERWKAFTERYYQFLPEDCEFLCPNHHAEIHRLYDAIIVGDRKLVGRPLSKYTWTQAERLMEKLESACLEWIETETPGIDSNYYGLTKKRRAPK
jgi:hypothetical protein